MSQGREVTVSRWCFVISILVFTPVTLQVASEAFSTSWCLLPGRGSHLQWSPAPSLGGLVSSQAFPSN